MLTRESNDSKLKIMKDFLNEYNGAKLKRGRNNHRRCSFKKGAVKNFAKFTGKHLCLRPATSLKKRL